MKTQRIRIYGHSKSNTERKVYNNTGLYQETRKSTTNILIFILRNKRKKKNEYQDKQNETNNKIKNNIENNTESVKQTLFFTGISKTDKTNP